MSISVVVWIMALSRVPVSDRLSDAVDRLRRQRLRRLFLVRRGRWPARSCSASASSSSASGWWRSHDEPTLSAVHPADHRRRDHRRRRRRAALRLDHQRPEGPGVRGGAVRVLRRPRRCAPSTPARRRWKSRCGSPASAPATRSITTPLTWVATANVILEVGAKPVFVDIDPVTRNIDLDRARGGDHAAHEARHHPGRSRRPAGRPRPPLRHRRAGTGCA